MVGRKRIGIRALKNDVSRIVNEVCERGDVYVVTNRGKPVAVLRPISESDEEDDRAAYVAGVMKMIDETAREVGRLSSGESAASVVSRQRR